MCSEARLPKKGTRRVRMMWTISVWVRSDSTNHPVWNRLASESFSAAPVGGAEEGAAAEDEPHQGEGRVVEDRADRPDEDHEALDVADVPLERLARSAPRPRCRWESRSGRSRRAGCWSGSAPAAWAGRAAGSWRPTTLNMLPKLELAPIRMYLTMLAKTFRPSMIPSSSTSRLFSRSTMSAASLATSTAESTEMPTSAAFSAGASLMPSPMNPTTWPPAAGPGRSPPSAPARA